MKVISIIRQRGQLTIPDSIRKIASWVNSNSVVSITVNQPDEIVIKPHQTHINWDEIWENIKKSRSVSGKGKLSAAEFLANDRKSH